MTTAIPSTPAKLVVDKSKKIHEQITPESWHKGSHFRDTSCCATGWLMKRYFYNYEPFMHTPEYEKLVAVIKARGCLFDQVCVYNDLDTTTFEDIKSMFVEADL